MNNEPTKSYLIACLEDGRAAIVDPLETRIDRYLSLLAYYNCKLSYIIDTHSHQDHVTGAFELKRLTGAEYAMGDLAPNPAVNIHLGDSDALRIGSLSLTSLATPGHSPDGISLYDGRHVFTGDTLMIGSAGRTDLVGGDPHAAYKSITEKLFGLPDSTVVLPSHDYRGNTESTIGKEKATNAAIAGKSEVEFVARMRQQRLALPTAIQEALQVNTGSVMEGATGIPAYSQLNAVRRVTTTALSKMLLEPDRHAHDLLVLDVREPHEWHTPPLNHIRDALLIPVQQLAERAEAELAQHKQKHVVCVCRSGVRSATAAALLTGLGFPHVSNLSGGMLAWRGISGPAAAAAPQH